MGYLVKVLIAAVVYAAVTSLAARSPRFGGLVLTFPILSIVAFILTWQQFRDIDAVSRLARETLVLVPLGLPFFIPLAFAARLHLSFWPAIAIGLILAAIPISLWVTLGPKFQ